MTVFGRNPANGVDECLSFLVSNLLYHRRLRLRGPSAGVYGGFACLTDLDLLDILQLVACFVYGRSACSTGSPGCSRQRCVSVISYLTEGLL